MRKFIKISLLLLLIVFFFSFQNIYAKNGYVKIKYNLNRYSIIASNQIVIWIKDANGKYIDTVYATKFMARGGYKNREDCCPIWISESNWINASNNEIDAVSGATQKSGIQEVTWDCMDKNGNMVPAGIYIYQIEANIYWDERILFTGKIEIGNNKNSSKPTIKYFHTKFNDKKETAEKSIKKYGNIIEDVEATFYPE